MRRRAISLICIAAACMVSDGAPAAAPAKNEIVPLIQMDQVPLTDAIRQLARQARLNIILDPRLSQAPFAGMTVSIRWQDVTAREALNALLDNYGLEMVESPRSSPSR